MTPEAKKGKRTSGLQALQWQPGAMHPVCMARKNCPDP